MFEFAQPLKATTPITSEAFAQICVHLCQEQNRSFVPLRILAFITLAYFGFLRSAEILQLTIGDVSFVNSHATIYLQKSKTDQQKKGKTVFLANAGYPINPYVILQVYIDELKVRGARSDCYLISAASLLRHSPPRPVSYNQMKSQFDDVMKELGFPKGLLGFHSFRAGGATGAARAQVPDRVFQKHGRWKTTNVKNSYVEELDDDMLGVTRELCRKVNACYAQ